MPVVNTNTIKEWFRTLKKPTEDQFWAWLDSFRHKWEKVPMNDVDGLPKALRDKADLVNGIVPEEQLPFSIKTSEVLAIGAISASENSVSVGLHASGKNRVRLAGVIYERSFANNFLFTAVVNYYKILIVYALPEPGLFFLAEGAEALEAIEPELPEGAFVIRRIVVSTTGQIIEPETATGLKYAEEDGWRNINLTEVLTILPYSYDLRSSYYITGSVEGATIGGIRNSLIDRNASPSWDGKEFWIYNATGGDLPLDSTAVTDDDVFLFARSITLKSEQSCKVKLRRDALEIVGVMSSGELPDLSAYALNADLNAEVVNRAAADLLEKNERIAADALKVDKPTTDGTWMLQKVGAAFTWVAGVMQNIANTDLTNISARIFTQGNTFTWNTAGFFHYLKGLLDKTGNAAYTKVVVVHPTTGEMVTRDFADPQATTLAVQNASAAQKTAMRTALLGTAVPASPVINVVNTWFIKRNESRYLYLTGINLTPLEPISIWIENSGVKIFALNFYAISGTLLQTKWEIPDTFPIGEYQVKIQNGATVQGASPGTVRVVSESANLSRTLLVGDFIAKPRLGFSMLPNTTLATTTNTVTASMISTTSTEANGTYDAMIKTGNIFKAGSSWEVTLEMSILTGPQGSGLGSFPILLLTETTNANFNEPNDVIPNKMLLNSFGHSVNNFGGTQVSYNGATARIGFRKSGTSLITFVLDVNNLATNLSETTIDDTKDYAMCFCGPRISNWANRRQFVFQTLNILEA